MNVFSPFPSCARRGAVFMLVVTTLILGGIPALFAQNGANAFNNGFFQQRTVGGISIDANGMIGNAGRDVQGQLAQARAAIAQNIPAELQGAVPLRKISLRRLDEALAESLKTRKPLAPEVMLLGGLQEIRYLFVYPEQKDIVLVGPAEGWRIDAHGAAVGLTTGRPVMMLDDLMVALRTAAGAAQGGITCSIDPTPEGMTQLRTLLTKVRTIGNPQETGAAIEQALGRQQITFSGVPSTSHFACVLAAADYRMKRLAMNFEKSPVRGLPSYLSMLGGGGRGLSNMAPRWWLEPRYESLLVDPAGLAWELKGSSVKCMTEEDFFSAAGREHTGKANPLAQKWADAMTAHYAELSLADPVFGDLRNCMELAVVGAVVARHHLLEKAGNSFPVLMQESQARTVEMAAPRQVDSRVSMMQKGHNWVITASGGVMIRPQEIAAHAEQAPAPAAARAKVVPEEKRGWRWN